jgi:hypothetical protein
VGRLILQICGSDHAQIHDVVVEFRVHHFTQNSEDSFVVG